MIFLENGAIQNDLGRQETLSLSDDDLRRLGLWEFNLYPLKLKTLDYFVGILSTLIVAALLYLQFN